MYSIYSSAIEIAMHVASNHTVVSMVVRLCAAYKYIGSFI